MKVNKFAFILLAASSILLSCTKPETEGKEEEKEKPEEQKPVKDTLKGSKYELTLNLAYPSLADGTILYEWDGTEKVGLLFGNTTASTAESETPGQLAIELPSTAKGVFSATVDIGTWTMDDLRAVVYPCDEHSWIKVKNGELRIVMHTGGGYTNPITYTQTKNGVLAPSNAPVFAPLALTDLKETDIHRYTASKTLLWGCSLMKINVFGTPKGCTSDEYITGIRLYTNTSKSMTGNSEYNLTGSSAGSFAINGSKSNCATVNLAEQVRLSSTSASSPASIFTALAARQGEWEFSTSSQGYVSVVTNRSVYTVALEKSTYNISTGVMTVLDVNLDKVEPFAFEAGAGSVTFSCSGTFLGKDVTLHYYVPEGDIASMPVQFVMHGTDRNGDTYRDYWKDDADKYKVVILAPTFTDAQFTDAQYQEANIETADSKFNPQSSMTFSIIEDIFDFFLANSSSKATSYNLWGHSAGGQFAHRFMEFAKAPRAARIVAANPGWYTFPDAAIAFPYGWKNVESSYPSITRALMYAKDFTLMLGTSDVNRDSNLRTTAKADAQGMNRYERGTNFFKWCQEDASSGSYTFNWKKVEVPGVAHEGKKMGAAAAAYLYGSN